MRLPWVVTAVTVCWEVRGPLADVLATQSALVRHRLAVDIAVILIADWIEKPLVSKGPTVCKASFGNATRFGDIRLPERASEGNLARSTCLLEGPRSLSAKSHLCPPKGFFSGTTS